MRSVRLLDSELRKLLTLPSTRVAAAIGVLAPAALAWLNSGQVRRAHELGRPELVSDGTAFDTAIMPAALLVSVAAVIVGVTAMSSEYARNSPDAGGSRQIVATLTASPTRLRVLAAKAGAVALTTALIGWAGVAASAPIAVTVLGSYADPAAPLATAIQRTLGGTLYWILLAWIALAIASLARSGLVPLALLIVNSAIVPFSLLLSKITSLAYWLPDLAGRNLFGFPAEFVLPGGLDATLGGIVMAAWSIGLLTAAGIAFARRDV